MDLNKIKQKLASLEAPGGSGSKNKWTPTPGKHVIRIVPYLHNKDFPFIELYFYYKLAKKTLLSPVTFGKPDPVQEFVDKLKSTGDKEDWKTAVNLQAKSRTFVPIIVRGKEEEGVKFWGFGKTIYQELLKIIDDPDYGDITHPKTGRDITVEVTKTEKPWPEIMIRVKPNPSEMTSSKEVLESIKEMPKCESMWTEPSYEELKTMLETYLSNEDTEQQEVAPNVSEEEDPFAAAFDVSDIPSTKAPAAKTPIKESTTDDEFDKLFS